MPFSDVEPHIDLTVPAAPTAAAQARRALAGAGLVGPAHEPVLLLLVSELVSNSVRHAGLDRDEGIRLRARLEDDRALVEVRDPGSSGKLPDKLEPVFGEVEPGGLGLVLVDKLADRWGVARDADGTAVWFELSCA
jgi:anti-sigma regulatory factor (Ser/Thr protein kinase)